MDTSDGGATAMDDADAAFFSRTRNRCCCFSAPWHSSSSYTRRPVAGGGTAGPDGEWWHQVGATGSTAGSERTRWWRRGVDALMKVREWSELVAGPRWKTFIRRFRRAGHHHHRNTSGGGGRKLNYDALSYALNFDEGHGSPEGDDGAGGGAPDFTARFAGSARSSMDLGAHFHHHPQPRTPPAAIAIAPAATARG